MPSAIVAPGVTASASGFARPERLEQRCARVALHADETRHPVDQPGVAQALEAEMGAEQQRPTTERRHDSRRRPTAELLKQLVREGRGSGEERRLPQVRPVGDPRTGGLERTTGRLAGGRPGARHGHDDRPVGPCLQQLGGRRVGRREQPQREAGTRGVGGERRPAFPDESTTISRTPRACSHETVTLVPRSLNDPVGSPPSSLATVSGRASCTSTSAVCGLPERDRLDGREPAPVPPHADGALVGERRAIGGWELELERRATRAAPPGRGTRRSRAARPAPQPGHGVAIPSR